MAEYDGISSFRKAGLQRLRDAEELLQPPTLEPQQSEADTRHLRGAVYLAGYSVECVLKEYIISRTPRAKTLSEALDIRERSGKSAINLNSAAGHNLALLLSLTDLEASIASDPKHRTDWNACLKWKSSWRYDTIQPTRAFAEEFVAAARSIYYWIKQRV